LAPARAASPFVPYRTQSGATFHWAQTCVPLHIYLDGLPGLTSAETASAVAGAAAAWDASTNACSFLTLQPERGTGPGPTEGFDGLSAVTYQTTMWCHRSADGTCPAQPYPPESRAITSVFVSRATGQIFEADVELNAASFTWGDLVSQPSMTAQDLQDLLTHELGHVIGLDSSCWTSVPGGTAPLDDQGQPAPPCDTASQAVRDTTMFANFLPGETNKRTLEADDRNGLCATYPRTKGPEPRDGSADADMCASLPDGAAGGPEAAAGSAGGAGAGGAGAGAAGASAGAGGRDAASGVAGGASGGCGCALADRSSPFGIGAILSTLALISASRRRRSPAGRSRVAEVGRTRNVSATRRVL
jgi:hypothetical protein